MNRQKIKGVLYEMAVNNDSMGNKKKPFWWTRCALSTLHSCKDGDWVEFET